jgi:phosphoglucomutase
MPKDPLLIKTIVSSDMAEEVAATYGLKTINVLTGFKYIGDQINRLEAKKKEDSFVFGFEESYGYLSGTYVRDKDAVNAALLVCEMFCYYHNQGISLASKIEDLYRKYGYYLNTVHSYEFIGFSGFKKMQEVMLYFRKGLKEIGGKAIEKYLDYLQGLDGLPPADVVKYQLVGDCSIIIRPSGTEPKLKVYISIKAQDKETALLKEQQVAQALKKIINSFN